MNFKKDANEILFLYSKDLKASINVQLRYRTLILSSLFFCIKDLVAEGDDIFSK
jgi:hypothetical protein